MALKLATVCVFLIIHRTNAQSVDCSGNCNCPSSIEAVTCILNCDGTDRCKDSTLTCRAGDPCIVNCNGDNSCEGNTVIDASGATDATVNCDGANSCKGNTVINCGTDSCSISCTQSSSCIGTRVEAPDATSLSCTGSCESIASILTSSPTIRTTTQNPSTSPTNIPTFSPTKNPSNYPSISPTKNPTKNPSKSPTKNPSRNPSISPTKNPSISANPTKNPSKNPSNYPSISPTKNPSNYPSISPTKNPFKNPTSSPTQNPSKSPLITATEERFVLQTTSGTETPMQIQNSTQSVTMYPIYYILIGCSLLVVMGACICFAMIYIYFIIKHTKIVQDTQQKPVGEHQEGQETMFDCQNTNATSIHDIEIVQQYNGNMEVDDIINDIDMDVNMEKDPSIDGTEFEYSSDLTSFSSSTVPNPNTSVAQPYQQQYQQQYETRPNYYPNTMSIAMPMYPQPIHINMPPYTPPLQLQQGQSSMTMSLPNQTIPVQIMPPLQNNQQNKPQMIVLNNLTPGILRNKRERDSSYDTDSDSTSDSESRSSSQSFESVTDTSRETTSDN